MDRHKTGNGELRPPVEEAAENGELPGDVDESQGLESPPEPVRQSGTRGASVAEELILVGEPGLAHLQNDPTFIEETTKAAKRTIVDGLRAKDKDGEPDHKIRISYLKTVIEMNCWSADARMKIRNHVRQMERDRMEFEVKRGGSSRLGAGMTQVPPEALEEMRR